MLRRLEIGLVAAVVLTPLVLLVVTGSAGTFAVLYGIETLIVVSWRAVRKRLGLPAWKADEADITRLRRWSQSRRTS
jgi:hypothetical protein